MEENTLFREGEEANRPRDCRARESGGEVNAVIEKPMRVQLSRKKGFKLPPNTVVVSRPSKWGNPFKADDPAYCVHEFRKFIWWPSGRGAELRRALPELRGKNLACWCKLSEACHADVLLELANKP